jgi:hypothetical protein
MTEDELFGMIKITKDLQASAKAAIDGMATERAAMAKDRAAMTATLAQQADAVNAAADSVSTVAASIRQAAADSIPAVEKAAGAAVERSVADSLNGASDAAVGAIGEAAKPLLAQIITATTNASTAAENLESAAKWYSWKVGGVLAAGVAGLMLSAYLIFGALVWWHGSKLEDLRKEKAALAADVVQMQANVSAWEKKGGRITLDSCDDSGKSRLCIPVSTNQGKGNEDYKAPFSNAKSGVQYVIPRGY